MAGRTASWRFPTPGRGFATCSRSASCPRSSKAAARATSTGCDGTENVKQFLRVINAQYQGGTYVANHDVADFDCDPDRADVFRNGGHHHTNLRGRQLHAVAS